MIEKKLKMGRAIAVGFSWTKMLEVCWMAIDSAIFFLRQQTATMNKMSKTKQSTAAVIQTHFGWASFYSFCLILLLRSSTFLMLLMSWRLTLSDMAFVMKNRPVTNNRIMIEMISVQTRSLAQNLIMTMKMKPMQIAISAQPRLVHQVAFRSLAMFVIPSILMLAEIFW